MAATPEAAESQRSSIGRVAAFVGALVRRSRRGVLVGAGLLVPIGFVVEGAGLLLLIPILGLALEPGAETRWPIVADLLAPLGAQSTAAKLGALLALFALLMLLRAIILHARDAMLGRLQVQFIERLRI